MSHQQGGACGEVGLGALFGLGVGARGLTAQLLGAVGPVIFQIMGFNRCRPSSTAGDLPATWVKDEPRAEH